jgi:hypothetical protein
MFDEPCETYGQIELTGEMVAHHSMAPYSDALQEMRARLRASRDQGRLAKERSKKMVQLTQEKCSAGKITAEEGAMILEADRRLRADLESQYEFRADVLTDEEFKRELQRDTSDPSTDALLQLMAALADE